MYPAGKWLKKEVKNIAEGVSADDAQRILNITSRVKCAKHYHI